MYWTGTVEQTGKLVTTQFLTKVPAMLTNRILWPSTSPHLHLMLIINQSWKWMHIYINSKKKKNLTFFSSVFLDKRQPWHTEQRTAPRNRPMPVTFPWLGSEWNCLKTELRFTFQGPFAAFPSFCSQWAFCWSVTALGSRNVSQRQTRQRFTEPEWEKLCLGLIMWWSGLQMGTRAECVQSSDANLISLGFLFLWFYSQYFP